ncbi:hypothetical protein [Microlunatus antarcticus]|uniref:Uncharacterized protein n=1 Tax=Microlunatus antarcticus TaxID=53388 RepID=A0A7W5P6A0_9ACTN|nr:hypothetical protein [Microlunatus antarcticus]MBB3326299.1 hypothetical protein [Microlunatus antarcticus]
MVWPWVLLFAVIALGGLGVLVLVALRVWRSARGLLAELDVAAGRAGELADLLAQVQVPQVQVTGATEVTDRTLPDAGSELTADDAWPGTVESYDHRGADAPGKKES